MTAPSHPPAPPGRNQNRPSGAIFMPVRIFDFAPANNRKRAETPRHAFRASKECPRHRPQEKNPVSSPTGGKETGKSGGIPYACARVNSGRG